MAALVEVPRRELVELSQITGREIAALFADEVKEWRRRFAWDFRASADLLLRYLQVQSLYGFALRVNRDLVGYTYFVCEGRKGLIGDFFVRDGYNHPSNELLLLETAVGALMRTSGVRRIESQLMMLRGHAFDFPFPRFLTRHNRMFMDVDSAHAKSLPEASPGSDIRLIPWAERYNEEIAHLVAAAYKGHVDSEINDQYRNIPGARHFLVNIIRYPGCGNFSPNCSMLAVSRATGRVCGVCLTSTVSDQSGHITQVCVLPALRGAGLGYELIRHSLLLLDASGCRTSSLTVTCSNSAAIRLYQSMGFQAKSFFPALVWEGF